MKALTRTKWCSLLVLGALVTVSTGAGAGQSKPMNTPSGAIKWAPYAPDNPLQVAILWGDRTKAAEYAMYLKMPAGFVAGRHSHTNDYHGVAIQGTWVHTNDGGKPVELSPGGFVMQPGKQVHDDSCKGTTECIILIHQRGPGDFIPAK